MAKLNEYLTVAEAAVYLGCCADTLRRYDRSNKLRARRHPITRYRLYLPSELDEFLRSVGDAGKETGAGVKLGKKPSKTRSRKRKG